MTFTGIDVVDHIIATVIICVGLISCFCGYRLFKLFLALAGFLFTLLIVFSIIYYFITPNLIIASVVGSVVGLAGAFGITFLPALGVFSLGSFFGFTISLVFIAAVRVECIHILIVGINILSLTSKDMQQDDVRDVVMFSLSICVGFISLRWKKATVLVGTSVLGAFSIITGVDNWGNSGFIKTLDDMLKYNSSRILTTQMQVSIQHVGPLIQAEIPSQGLFIGFIVMFVALGALGFSLQYFITGKIEEQDLSVSGQLPITIPKATCCNPYVRLFHKKVHRDEVPLLDVVTLDD